MSYTYLPTFFFFRFCFCFPPEAASWQPATRLIDVPISVDSDFGRDRKKKHKILIINFYTPPSPDVSLTDIPFFIIIVYIVYIYTYEYISTYNYSIVRLRYINIRIRDACIISTSSVQLCLLIQYKTAYSCYLP